jgi:hypothetical protein
MISLRDETLSAYDNHDELSAARTDFLKYIQQVLTDKKGDPLPLDEYSRVYADFLVKCWKSKLHSNHVAPTGGGKTTISRGFMTAKLGENPTLCGIVSGAADKVSINSVTLCRQIVLSAKFRAVYPNAIPDFERSMREGARGWKKDEFFFMTPGQQQDPALAAVPALPLGEGRRVDIGLFDDYVTLAVVNQIDGTRKYRERFFDTWLEGRMKNAGWAMLVHNCLRNDDLAHFLRADKRVASFWFGVTTDCERGFARFWNPPPGLGIIERPEEFGAVAVSPQDNATHEFEMPLPNRPGWSPDEIRAMSTATRMRNMHLIPMAPDDKMIPAWGERKFGGATVAQMLGVKESGNGLPMLDRMDRMRFSISAGVDLSSLRRRGTSIMFLVMDVQTGKIYPALHWVGAFRVEDIIARLDEAWALGFEPNAITVEDNAVQDLVLDSIKTIARNKQQPCHWASRILPFTTNHGNKFNPVTGLPSLNTEIENGSILWPRDEARRGVGHSQHWIALESAFQNCPRFIQPAQTPDPIMSFFFARQNLRLAPYVPAGSKAAGVRSRSGRVAGF